MLLVTLMGLRQVSRHSGRSHPIELALRTTCADTMRSRKGIGVLGAWGAGWFSGSHLAFYVGVNYNFNSSILLLQQIQV